MHKVHTFHSKKIIFVHKFNISNSMRISILLLLVLFLNSAYSQTTTDKTSTKKKVLTTSRDRFDFGVHFNNFYEKPDTLKVQWYSRSFDVHIMLDRPIGKSRFSFAPGLGIASTNYYHNSYMSIDTSSIAYFTPFSESISHKKNKMNITYAELPLELRYRTKPDMNGNSFKLGLGVKLGYALNSHTKYKGDDYTGLNRGSVHFKEIGIPNINTYRYGVTARVGYSIVSLVGYYGLSTYFKKDAGPSMKEFSIGISLNGF